MRNRTDFAASMARVDHHLDLRQSSTGFHHGASSAWSDYVPSQRRLAYHSNSDTTRSNQQDRPSRNRCRRPRTTRTRSRLRSAGVIGTHQRERHNRTKQNGKYSRKRSATTDSARRSTPPVWRLARSFAHCRKLVVTFVVPMSPLVGPHGEERALDTPPLH